MVDADLGSVLSAAAEELAGLARETDSLVGATASERMQALDRISQTQAELGSFLSGIATLVSGACADLSTVFSAMRMSGLAARLGAGPVEEVESGALDLFDA